jgi:1,2-phenylacetyl-CoA epoxidase catalytic subunit
MSETEQVPEEYREVALHFLSYMIQIEEYAADVAGYWLHRVPMKWEYRELRTDLAKMTYDEARHRNVTERMIRHLGGEDAVEDTYDRWEYKGEDSFHRRWTRLFTEGPDDWIEFLVTLPLLGDMTGVYINDDIANQSPDPLISDAFESLADDERMHGSISSEAIPTVIEEEDEEARRTIEEGIDRWLPVMLGIIGHPDDAEKEPLFEAEVVSLSTAELHENQYEQLHSLLDPLGIQWERLDDDEYLRTDEVYEYGKEHILDYG